MRLGLAEEQAAQLALQPSRRNPSRQRGLSDCSSTSFGITDGFCVLFLLCEAICCCLLNGGIEGSKLAAKFADLSCKLTDLSRQFFNVCRQFLRHSCLFVPGLFVGAHLGIAETLVCSIGLGLFHELHNHLLNHLPNFHEWIRGCFLCDQGQQLAAGLLCLLLQEI